MHPHEFYSSLFSPEKRDEVFVIMSFAEEFDSRWHNIIEPAIVSILKMKANRVDYRTSGQSVLHDIMDGICNSKIILADITCTIMKDRNGIDWPQRNGNVMWEVGVAHSIRLPDEVVLIRTDHEQSIFDLSQFRAFQYDDMNKQQSLNFITDIVEDRLKSIELSKSDYVRRCAEKLDPASIHVLVNNIPNDGSVLEIRPVMMSSQIYTRLYEIGVLKTEVKLRMAPDGSVYLVTYAKLSELGKSVRIYIARDIDNAKRNMEYVKPAVGQVKRT